MPTTPTQESEHSVCTGEHVPPLLRKGFFAKTRCFKYALIFKQVSIYCARTMGELVSRL